MMMMIVGELFNAASYAFVSAIIVVGMFHLEALFSMVQCIVSSSQTPMGALSVVICAILSSIFLKERLSLFGWIGCFQCITGSIIVAVSSVPSSCIKFILIDFISAKCSTATVRHYHSRVQTPLSCSWLPRFRWHNHFGRVGNCVFYCSEIWEEEYAMVRTSTGVMFA
jgi:Magnesium transporter NIPA